MAGDDDSDVRQALAVLGAAPIGYRTYRRPLVPAVVPVQPVPQPVAPTPTRLTLQWPARSFARRPEASLGEAAPFSPQPAVSLRAMSPRPVPSDDTSGRHLPCEAQPARLPGPSSVVRPVPANEAALGHGKLPLADMFRALADAPAAEATRLALPPMFRRL